MKQKWSQEDTSGVSLKSTCFVEWMSTVPVTKPLIRHMHFFILCESATAINSDGSMECNCRGTLRCTNLYAFHFLAFLTSCVSIFDNVDRLTSP